MARQLIIREYFQPGDFGRRPSEIDVISMPSGGPAPMLIMLIRQPAKASPRLRPQKTKPVANAYSSSVRLLARFAFATGAVCIRVAVNEKMDLRQRVICLEQL